ncbi:MAG TPA: DNA N-6-adenine-methyltransferase [Anaerolineales bacterium]|nr:DNA N-6-adenine-methyltransferase [Anaerolineales bacterium]
MSSVAEIANINRMGYVGKKPGSGSADRDSDSWYTPAGYINAARAVMGGIDLDPFSSDRANENVKAARILTEDRSAFSNAWRKDKRKYPEGVCVWMNPPYSGGIIGKAVDTFIENLTAGNIRQAVVLVNNATDTQWFKTLRENSSAVCFTHHRISFESPDGKRVSGNTRGQTFFYFGPESRAEAFVKEFSRFGWCISKSHGWRS